MGGKNPTNPSDIPGIVDYLKPILMTQFTKALPPTDKVSRLNLLKEWLRSSELLQDGLWGGSTTLHKVIMNFQKL